MDEEQNSKRRENGVKRAGNGGVVPPVEHQFKPGNQAAVGHRMAKAPSSWLDSNASYARRNLLTRTLASAAI